MAQIIPLPRHIGPSLDGRTRVARERATTRLAATILPFRRSTPIESNASKAYALYCRAEKLDEHPDTTRQAEDLYREAINLDPRLSIAYTNLGNISYRRGNILSARLHYDQALDIDPRQPEALYNLGYLELESGNPAQAIPLLKAAIASDPVFADAHYNLAMAYETQNYLAAQYHWRQYLKLEPTGMWADIAKSHLLKIVV